MKRWITRLREMPVNRWRWLLLGVVLVAMGVVTWFLVPLVPRDMELRVPLRAFRAGARKALSVSVTLRRDGTDVSHVSARFDARSEVPEAYTTHVSLVPGTYEAEVEVELPGRVAVRRATIEAKVGELMAIPPPLD